MGDGIELNLCAPCTPAEEKRLRAAGYAPVVRWVHVPSRSDEALKTIDALTRVERGYIPPVRPDEEAPPKTKGKKR